MAVEFKAKVFDRSRPRNLLYEVHYLTDGTVKIIANPVTGRVDIPIKELENMLDELRQLGRIVDYMKNLKRGSLEVEFEG